MKEYTSREIERMLAKCGYVKSRTTGSHAIWHNSAGDMAVVPVRLKAVIAHRLIVQMERSSAASHMI